MHRPGAFYLKVVIFFWSRAREKVFPIAILNYMNVERNFMRTGLHKRDKTTEIYFDEASPVVEIYTHNTALKKRLTTYAEEYPDLCKITDEDDELGSKRFHIQKGRFSVRLTKPYSEKRRIIASNKAKKSCMIAKLRAEKALKYEK
jgi:hypothetical protein